jgi:hypothetical protein
MRQRAVLGVLFMVTLAAFAVATISEFNRQAQVRCQAEYNETNNIRTRLLTEVTAKERAAERRRDDALDATFLDASLDKPAAERTPEERAQVLDLFNEYRDAARDLAVERAVADRARAANPVPAPPSAVC